MILTKQTVIEWASMDDQMHQDLDIDRLEFLSKLVDQEKTDGSYVFGSDNNPLIGIRPFIDETTAQEYIDFITALAKKYNCIIISTKIQDYTV